MEPNHRLNIVNDLENRKTGDSNNGQAYTSQTQIMARPTPVRRMTLRTVRLETQTMARPTPVRRMTLRTVRLETQTMVRPTPVRRMTLRTVRLKT